MAKAKKSINKSKCYTFIKTYHYGNETYVKWQRAKLDSKEYEIFSKFVVETEAHNTKKSCGCK